MMEVMVRSRYDPAIRKTVAEDEFGVELFRLTGDHTSNNNLLLEVEWLMETSRKNGVVTGKQAGRQEFARKLRELSMFWEE